MINRYGRETVEDMRHNRHKVCKWQLSRLVDKIEYYKNRLKDNENIKKSS